MKTLSLGCALLLLSLLPARGAHDTIIYEPYTVSTLAGWGSNEHTVDGPPDTAEFANPNGLAVDRKGNVYVCDIYSHTIRKVTPDGTASTFAGLADASGSDDGTGSAARFSFPEGIAIDGAGIIYVADTGNQTIRKITPRAEVTTVAGSPGLTGLVDGVGSEARFYGPTGVAVNEKTRDLFVVDRWNYAVRKVAPDGTVTTFAGGPPPGSRNGTGREAQFNVPWDIAADKHGNLYVGENVINHYVRKITPDAVVTTLAKSIDSANGVTVDRDSNVFVTSNTLVKKITPTGQVSDFVGGNFGSEDGTGLNAQFAYPMRIATDRAGNFYVSDAHEFYPLYSNETIRKITPAGVVTTRKIAPDGQVSTIAGKVQTPGYVDGDADDARFDNPWAMAVDLAGNVYVADQGNSVIRKITPAGQVSSLAQGYNFSGPEGVAVDTSGNVYIAATNNQTIDKVTPDGEVSVFAGSPGNTGDQNGTGGQARFRYPAGLAFGPDSNLYVADSQNEAVRKITPAAVVTTLTGDHGQGNNDGDATVATFYDPSSVAVDSAGNVYVADSVSYTIRKVTPTGSVTTLAGSPKVAGWVDDSGAAARFAVPNGIAIDGSGTLYIADVYNNTIRKAVPTP